MIIAHLSDLHVSRLGARLTNPMLASALGGDSWELLRAHGLFRLETRRAEGARLRFRDQIRLVDDSGSIHKIVKVSRWGKSESSHIDDLLRLADVRIRTSANALVEKWPSDSEVKHLLHTDPDNVNIRFCAVLIALKAAAVDHVLVTGDLTDDGDAYNAIEAGFSFAIEKRAFTCIPGNHDVYASIPIVVEKSQRKTSFDKRKNFGAFMQRIGLPPQGSFIRYFGHGLTMACLDSCHAAPVIASASGMVVLKDLEKIDKEWKEKSPNALRLACLHHHVVNPPIKGTGMAPMEAGMRLRNATKVFDQLKAMKVALVMNGHRHLGYRFHLAHSPLILSAPSTTIGCRSGAKPFYWCVDVDRHGIHKVTEQGIPMLA